MSMQEMCTYDISAATAYLLLANIQSQSASKTSRGPSSLGFLLCVGAPAASARGCDDDEIVLLLLPLLPTPNEE